MLTMCKDAILFRQWSLNLLEMSINPDLWLAMLCKNQKCSGIMIHAPLCVVSVV